MNAFKNTFKMYKDGILESLGFSKKILNTNMQEMTAAFIELQEAQSFFNHCEAHQFDYANARLTAARAKVDVMIKKAKELERLVNELEYKEEI